MSTQPEALRLAERFEDVGDWYEFDAQSWFPLAAAELRRLHALNAELLAALQGLEAMAERYRPAGYPVPDAQKAARAAIALATP